MSANNSQSTNVTTTTQTQASAQNNSGIPQNGSQQAGSQGQGQTIAGCLSNEVQVSGVCVLAIPFCIEYNLITKKCSVCTKECILSDFGYCVPLILFLSSNSTNTANPQVSIISTDLKVQKNMTAADCGQNQYFWYDQCVTIGTECVLRAQNGTC